MALWHRLKSRFGLQRRWRLEDLEVIPGVASAELGNSRSIMVYVPPSYRRGTRRYPVIYMQDGQNLFDPALSFAEPWRLDRALRVSEQQGAEAIVVAVPNMGEERLSEYSPFDDPLHGEARGDQYLDFLVGTVKPLIDARYRTRPEREMTGIGGSSMGGLISLYALFVLPEWFGFGAVLSPSLWYAEEAIFARIERGEPVAARIHLDIGTEEGDTAVRHARRMRDLLVSKGFQLGRDLQWVEDAGAGHHEPAWGERFAQALRFLLPR